MSQPVIIVDNIGKQYKIGVRLQARRHVGEAIWGGITAPIRRLRTLGEKSAGADLFWALKDVSFQVQPGEVVGIIGRNGAGKSTLLKILSRITVPTTGRATIRGRVGSLLEVGTGFHRELTGRENIYLNGAILGMKKAEIDSRFDEIVAFSEVEKFLDTPVKRYSSGMYVRLAFAVAAHLEPEILLVDEVLAVGDFAFQKKCLGKMRDVAGTGRTVLFVSHNMEAIRRLCPRAILIANGRIDSDGGTDSIVSAYLSEGQEHTRGVREYDIGKEPGDDFVRLNLVRIANEAGNVASAFRLNEGLSVEIEFTVLEPISNFHTSIRVFTQDGILVFCSGDWDESEPEEASGSRRKFRYTPQVRSDAVGQCETPRRPVSELMASCTRLFPGRYLSRCIIPGNLLNRGAYSVTVRGLIPQVRYIFVEQNVLSWEIADIGGAGGAGDTGRPGILRPQLKWRLFSLRATRGD